MPTKARLNGDRLFVDDVDFDRSARRLMRSLLGRPAHLPLSLSACREQLARVLGHDGLHALRAVAAPSSPKPTARVLPVVASVPYVQPMDMGSTASLVDLGFHPEHVRLLMTAMASPAGAIAVAGVTGAGKTATIQGLMSGYRSQNEQAKIVTVEYRAEHDIKDAVRILIQDAHPMQWHAHRSIAIQDALRMGPDLIMVDEIADAHAAKGMRVAVESGHKLITAVHANGAFGILERISRMGIPAETLGSAGFFSALVYQTRLGKTCTHCRIPCSTDEALRLLPGAIQPGDTLYHRNASGCEMCNFTGTHGYTLCAEVVIPDSVMRERISRGQFSGAHSYWQNVTPRHGKGSMTGVSALGHGIMKVRSGEIALDTLKSFMGPLRSN